MKITITLTPEKIQQIALGIAAIAHATTDGTFDALEAKAKELVEALSPVLPAGSFTDAELHGLAVAALDPALDILRKTGGIPADLEDPAKKDDGA